MSNIFDLSVVELYSLAISLIPGHKEQLNPEDATALRTRIIEWLLINNFSTLHKFKKSDDDSWAFPHDYTCDSCRKKKEEYSYVPKPIDNPVEIATTSEPVPVLAGEEFVTFEVKDKPKKSDHKKSPKEAESGSLSGYYSSATDCLFSFGACLTRPFRICFVGRTLE